MVEALEAIEALNNFLHRDLVSKYPDSEWEVMYKKAVAAKKLLELEWDKLQKEPGCEWLAEARKDKVFKEYFRLRLAIDKAGG